MSARGEGVGQMRTPVDRGERAKDLVILGHVIQHMGDA